MAQSESHAPERDELSRIDYFLDHLARAVERGEVPRSSYDVVAPRYLARRQDLVGIITGRAGTAAVYSGSPSAAAAPAYAPAAAPGPAVSPAGAAFAPRPTPRSAAARRGRPGRESKPVQWTTVLLFLGAFLVIVASAIFAIAVWNVTSPAFKLAFLGALTVAFYVGGWYARTRLKLKAGSAALTVVGSAMLLFDCWIVISGYHLQGPLPWAVALFACSAVYLLTEIRLGDRFYGIAAAAAQVGWWWLMADGLNWTVPVRMAGIAVIALAWQLVAERAKDDPALASLSGVLLWAAPIVEIGALVGLLGYMVVSDVSSWTLVWSSVALAVCGAVVAERSTPLPQVLRPWAALAFQVPLFVATAALGTATWGNAGVLAVAAVAYTVFSLLEGGAAFAIAALATELTAVGYALDLWHVSNRVQLVVAAALAVSWVLASRLTRPEDPPVSARMKGAPGFSLVAVGGGFALLLVASAAVPGVGSGVPLSGVHTLPSDAVLAACVLVAWATASLVRRLPAFAFAAALWSFYALAAVEALAFPAAHSALYAVGLVALAGAWLAARGPMARFYRIPREAFGWTMRAIALLALIGGLAAEAWFFHTASSWQGAVLALSIAALFAADTTVGGPAVSAVAASFAAVLGAFLLGGATSASRPALLASGAALALGALSAGLRRRWVSRAGWLGVGAAVAGTIAVVAQTGLGGWGIAAAFALVALAWAAAAVAAGQKWLAFFAGLAAYAAVAASLAAADPYAAVTVTALSATGLALGIPSAIRATGRGGRFAGAGAALALAGLVGLLCQAVAAWSSATLGEFVTSPTWLQFGRQGVAVALLVLGAYVVAMAVMWEFEPGLYVGFGVVLLSAFSEMHALHFTTAEVYSTLLALYLVAMGYLFASRKPERECPVAIDAAAVIVGLGVPVVLVVSDSIGSATFVHTAWAIGLSLVAIGAGIVLRVRWYLFGGAAALAFVATWRSISYLAQFWWLVLGLIGVAMLVIALTWERQRLLLSETQVRLRESFESWR